MVWGALSWRVLGPLVVLREKVSGEHYSNILEDHLHPLLQTVFPGDRPLFQNDSALVPTARWVQTWLDEHNDEVKHLTWYPQSIDLNIIEPL